MDECDHLTNIDPSPSSDASLKRKSDGTADELTFPCKKVAVSPIPKPIVLDVSTTPTNNVVNQVKLSKAEREALKAEKAKEREMERQKREADKVKREEERLKREDERLKKVFFNRECG